MWKLALAFAFSLGLTIPASAQNRGLVMYVGEAPDYRLSVGIATPNGERYDVSARIEFASDCTPTGVQRITVARDELYPLREVNAGESAEAYGELHVALYRAMVAARGATGTAEYRACVQRVMTERAASQLGRRDGM